MAQNDLGGGNVAQTRGLSYVSSTQIILSLQNRRMELDTIIEIISVLFSLIFLFLVMQENIWCWLFGIISSALGIYLMLGIKLYSEATLYFFYVLFGIYGWYVWANPKEGKELTISKLSGQKHILWIGIGVVVSLLLGYIVQKYTDANKSYIDAHTTTFSFIATYLEAHKFLYTWIYWLVLNGVTVWLYYTQGLSIYAGLMVVYFVMSGVGFWRWREKYLGSK